MGAIPMKNLESMSLTLDKIEALVLFDMLSREIDDRKGKQLRAAIRRDGELWALNGLLCVLEKELIAPFQGDYKQQVERANTTLERLNGGPWSK